MKYNFRTVLCVIEEHLAPEVDAEETDEKMELPEVDCQATRAIRARQETSMDVRTAGVPRARDAKMETDRARFCYHRAGTFFKSLDLEGSWCLVGNLGYVHLAGPLGGQLHAQQSRLSKGEVSGVCVQPGGSRGKHIRTSREPAPERSAPHPVSGRASFREGFIGLCRGQSGSYTLTLEVWSDAPAFICLKLGNADCTLTPVQIH